MLVMDWGSSSPSPESASSIHTLKPDPKRPRFRQVPSAEVRNLTHSWRQSTPLYPQQVRRPTKAIQKMPRPRQKAFLPSQLEELDELTPLEGSSDSTQSDESSSNTSQSSWLAEQSIKSNRTPPPVTVLQKGNSDPFNSFSVQVSANVTRLITFGRDVLNPALYVGAVHYNPEAVAQSLQQLWKDVSSNLQDKVAAYAYLARNAVLVRSLGPSGAVAQELVYKSLSNRFLRERLAKLDDDGLHTFQTYFIIYAIFQVELFDRNFESASLHMKMLSTLMTQHESGDYESVDLSFIYRPLYTDANLSAMAFIRPHFDPEGPVWKRFHPLKVETLNDYPAIGPDSLEIDASVSGDRLRSVFFDIKTIATIRVIVFADPSSAKPSSWLFAFSQGSLCTARLMNLYFDSLENLLNQDDSGSNARQAYQTAYLSLAATLWVRQLLNIENAVLGTQGRMFVAYPKLLAGMRDALTREEADSPGTEHCCGSTARLWTLYVGAAFEELQNQTSDSPGAKRGWFQRRLAAQAKQMHLQTWQAVKVLLQRILYSEELKPHGSQWIWRILSDEESAS